MEKLLSIGKILNFHGIKGEVKVGYSEGGEGYLTEIKEVYATKGSKTSILNIEKVRFHKKFAIIKFRELNSIDEVMEFKGAYLKAPKELLTEYLEEDEFYLDDLQGLDVYDIDKNHLGKVSGILNLKGQDLISIKNNKGKEQLVPFKKELVPEVSLEENKIVINNIEGLIDQ